MFDVIERLKSDWTDKFVVIDSAAPELARFANATGVVRTVNMNGRCLVEFDQFNNVGWYDIDPSALKIVSQPRPKPVEKEAAKPAAAAKAPAAAKPAKPAASAKPAGGRPSTADILAAARGKAAPAAGKPEAAAGKRPSTAEILAQARAAKAAAPAAEADGVAPAAEAPQARPAAAKPAAAKPAAGGPPPTTTADKIAWCRAHDGT
jgi:hypothetical protein